MARISQQTIAEAEAAAGTPSTVAASTTVGDGTAEDTKLVFDGNALDFRIGIDDGTDTLEIGKGNAHGTTGHVTIDTNGIMTKPLQPCFHAFVSSQTNNLSTGSDITCNFINEVWDLNGDYDTSNKTFTAPVTGKYMFLCQFRIEAMDSAANYFNLKLITSNNTYRDGYDIKSWGINDPDFFYMQINTIADMDASDTASMAFFQSAGTAQADSAADTRPIQDGWFSAYLLT